MAIITVSSDRVALQARYHPQLSERARRLRGRFHGKQTGWVFGMEHEQAVRDLCHALYGVDGRPETLAESVTLRIEACDRYVCPSTPWHAFNDDIWLCDRQIAVRPPGARIARPGRGVKFLAGLPHLSCSTISHDIRIDAGTVFLLKDVPRMALPRFEAALTDHGSWVIA